MSLKMTPQQKYGHLWWQEAERYDRWDDENWSAVECAELAEELKHLAVMADHDPNYWGKWTEWSGYVYENDLMLAIEQSCHEGVLLPWDQRGVRLSSCPDNMLSKLHFFFKRCPAHVRAYVALAFYLLVRMDRAQRTGSPEWRPETAVPDEVVDHAFFRPPVLKFRNYAR